MIKYHKFGSVLLIPFDLTKEVFFLHKLLIFF